MATARTLSTVELGSDRYYHALHSNLWPVQVRLPPQPPSPSPTKPLFYQLKTTDQIPNKTHPLILTARNDWRVTLSAPPGPLSYTVHSRSRLVSTGRLQVHPPHAPISAINTTLAKLNSQHGSGAFVQAATSADQALFAVRFVYQEHVWLATHVYVRAHHFKEPGLELVRVGCVFQATAELPKGDMQYRFCVIPREAVTVHSAPLTRLGWDEAASENNNQLVSWTSTLNVMIEAQVEAQVETQVEQQIEQQIEQQVKQQVKQHANESAILRFLFVTALVCAGGVFVIALSSGRKHDDESDTDAYINISASTTSNSTNKTQKGDDIRSHTYGLPG